MGASRPLRTGVNYNPLTIRGMNHQAVIRYPFGAFQLGKWGYPKVDGLVHVKSMKIPSFEMDDDWGY